MEPRDFRSEASESAEGKGLARRAWDLYAETTKKATAPALEPAAAAVARSVVADLIGFWVLWHLYGGFEGLERFGFHRATIFRKVKRFRLVFGAHPDEKEFPGLVVDPEAYWRAAAEAPKDSN